jgi:hypothetical protein
MYRRSQWNGIPLVDKYMHAATVILGVSSFLVAIFQCITIPSSWGSGVVGNCIHIPTLSYANAGIMISLDAILYIMLTLSTWSIQLRRA